MVSCCIPQCKSGGPKDPSITYHAFPSNPELYAKWVKNINFYIHKGGTWFPQSKDVVCSKHFVNNDFRLGVKLKTLKPKCVPSVFEKSSFNARNNTNYGKCEVSSKSPMIVKVIKPSYDEIEIDDHQPLSEMLKMQNGQNVLNKQVQNMHIRTETNSNAITLNSDEVNCNINSNGGTSHHLSESDLLPSDSKSTKTARSSDGMRKKQKCATDLIEIGPSTFLKINPDIINVTKKVTPSGSTVLQFVMNPNLGLSAEALFKPIVSNSSSISEPLTTNSLLTDVHVTSTNTSTGPIITNAFSTGAPIITNAFSTGAPIITNAFSAGAPIITTHPSTGTPIITTNAFSTGGLLVPTNPSSTGGPFILTSPFPMNRPIVTTKTDLSSEPIFVTKSATIGTPIVLTDPASMDGPILVTNPISIGAPIANGGLKEKHQLEVPNETNMVPDTTTTNEALESVKLELSDTCLAPAVLSTTFPVTQKLSLSMQQKHNAMVRQKNRQIYTLKTKIEALIKKVDELETKCIVQERQLDFSSLKRLKIIKKNAAKGESNASFIMEQIRGYFSNTSFKWSKSTLNQCSVWCRKAPYAYEYFKKADLFRLPCVTTVKRYMKKNPEITQQIKNRTLTAHIADSENSSSDFEFDDENENNEESPTNAGNSVSNQINSQVLSSSASCDEVVDSTSAPSKESTSVAPNFESSSTSQINHESSKTCEMSSSSSDTSQQGTEMQIEAVHKYGATAQTHNRSDQVDIPVTNDDMTLFIESDELSSLKLNGQNIIVQPGNVIHLNSELCDIQDVRNQYFVIPTTGEHSENLDHQYSAGQPVSYILQNEKNDEHLIYIANDNNSTTENISVGLPN